MEKNWFRRIMSRKIDTKQCDIHVVSNTEGKLLCENVIHHTCKHFDDIVGCDGCLVKDFEAK